MLEPTRLRIAPGTSGHVTIRVRNTGSIVDEIALSISRPDVAWATIVPESLRLYPGTEGEAELRLEPPREPDPRAGLLEVVVSIQSRERAEASVDQVVIVEIEPFAELAAALEPKLGSARRELAVAVRLQNGGNHVAPVTLAATDPTSQLGFHIDPAELALEPGAEGVAWVTVRAPRAIWLGSPRTHPYEVAVSAGSSPRRVLDGRFEQQRMVPRLALAAVAALGAVLLAVGLAFAAGAFPGGSVDPTATPAVTASATPSPTPSPTPTATPSPTPSPTPGPTPSPTPVPMFRVTVTFNSILVLDDADPGINGVGEVWLNFTVNGETRRWPASGTRGVGSGDTAALTGVAPVVLTLGEADRLVLSVVGWDYDPTSEDDPLGAVDRTYAGADGWGRGSHDEISTKPDGQFRLRYTVEVVQVP